MVEAQISSLVRGVLNAALREPHEATAAWRAVRRELVLDELRDPELIRLLPLVYRNLCLAGSDDPDLVRLKGIYRRVWYETQLQLHGAAEALTVLHDAGVTTMVLKGVPLALAYYEEPALRPMADADVLVPLEQMHDAVSALEAAGWTMPPGRRLSTRVELGQHGLELHRARHNVDLHWHPSLAYLLPGGGDTGGEIWRRTEALIVVGVPTRMPAPADLLLHVIVHAFVADARLTHRWVVDATVVVRGAQDRIDWETLVHETERLHLGPLLVPALKLVRAEFGAPVPEHVVDRLSALPSTPRQRRAARTIMSTSSPLRRHWSATTIGWTSLQATRAFPAFLRARWLLDRTHEVPLAVTRKLAGRAAKRPRSRG